MCKELQDRITALETTIDAFKKYDAERKLYISSLKVKIGELESYISELEETKSGNKLKVYKATMVQMIKKLAVYKALENKELDVDLIYGNIDAERRIEALKEKIKKLENKVKIIREANNELISQLNKLRNI